MADDERGRVLAFPQAPEAIELKHLRAFVAVAEELNFSRAAERLHISQPALSRQIRSLEQLLGIELLRRTKHRVELTIAGEALLDRARQLLTDVDEAVSATLSIGGELAARLTALWKPLFEVASRGPDLGELRAAYERFHAQFAPPPEVDVVAVTAGGVPGFEIGLEPGKPPTVLYLHGGGFVIGSAFGHKPLIGALAAASGETILAPEYRLAPEHPFPAAVEDCERAFEWMLERGTPAERIVFAGDSAGCALAMSVVLTRREKGLDLPGGLMFFCPGLDFSGRTLERLAAEDAEVAVMLENLRAYADAYLGGHSIDDPIVSCLRADLTGLPPILIQAATGDPQREDAHVLNELARKHGVESHLELYPVDTHAFQTFWSFLPEAMEGVERGGEFVRGVAAGLPAGRARLG